MLPIHALCLNNSRETSIEVAGFEGLNPPVNYWVSWTSPFHPRASKPVSVKIKCYNFIPLPPVALRPNVGRGLLFLEVSRSHTQRRTTVGRTPPDEWRVRGRHLYLTTHNIHNRQTTMSPAGFEPTVSTARAARPLGPASFNSRNTKHAGLQPHNWTPATILTFHSPY